MPLKIVAMVRELLSARRAEGERAHSAEGLVHDDRDGVREVQRANRPERRDPEDRRAVPLEEIVVEARALAAEDEGVAGLEIGFQVALCGGGAEEAEAGARVAVL